MSLSRLIARPMLSSIFLVGGLNALRNAPAQAAKAAPVADKLVRLAHKVAPQAPIPSDPVQLVRINAATQIAAGLTLATGRAPRLSAAVLGASLVPTTLAGHRFWELDDPAQRTAQRLNFAKNVSLLGGLVIAAGDTDGKPGVAWRARRVANDARREARHLARAARREAKLAKAQLT
ncbi:MAG: DoxX family protein [Actinomycetota bacterium]|nr:DoxX family protein [Actinomycetota bacterium]